MAYRWLLIVLLIAQTAAAQNYIEGRVVSAEEESPLVDASVFLNNTTIGTITGSNGYFKLSGIPSGSYELVVSMIGYHKYVKSIILDENTEYILDIKLTAQPTVLQELTIIPNNTETWEKWGLLFTETFIGLTPNAEKTKIKNTKDIRFIYSNQKLEAYAVKPLRIENNALGYKIEYHLEEFEIDFKAKTSYYAGFPRFIEPRTVKTKHKRERENAYDASLLKFIRMVYKNQLVKDGYIVRKMEFKPNLERQRVDSLYNSFMKTEVNADGTMRGSFLPDPIYTEDSLSYFREISCFFAYRYIKGGRFYFKRAGFIFFKI